MTMSNDANALEVIGGALLLLLLNLAFFPHISHSLASHTLSNCLTFNFQPPKAEATPTVGQHRV